MTAPVYLVTRRLWATRRLGPAALRLAQMRLNGKPIVPRAIRDHKTVEEPPEQQPAAESEVS